MWFRKTNHLLGFHRWLGRKESGGNTVAAGDAGSIHGWGRSPGGGQGSHSSILAWSIPWAEEPGGLQSIGLQRVGYDWSDLAGTHAVILQAHVYNQGVQICRKHSRGEGRLWTDTLECKPWFPHLRCRLLGSIPVHFICNMVIAIRFTL